MQTKDEVKPPETSAQEQEPKLSWKTAPILAFDTRVAGLGVKARIVEVALLQYCAGNKVSLTLSWIINPGEIDWEDPGIVKFLADEAIDRDMLSRAVLFNGIVGTFNQLKYVAAVWCAHGLAYKMDVIGKEFERAGKPTIPPEGRLLIDIEIIDRGFHPGMESYDLASIAARWGVEHGGRKGALSDAVTCNQILKAMMPSLPDDPQEMMDVAHWFAQAKEAAGPKETQGGDQSTTPP